MIKPIAVFLVRITPAGSAGWRLNGILKKSVAGCIDVDLGFTPATNLIPSVVLR